MYTVVWQIPRQISATQSNNRRSKTQYKQTF